MSGPTVGAETADEGREGCVRCGADPTLQEIVVNTHGCTHGAECPAGAGVPKWARPNPATTLDRMEKEIRTLRREPMPAEPEGLSGDPMTTATCVGCGKRALVIWTALDGRRTVHCGCGCGYYGMCAEDNVPGLLQLAI